MKKVIFILTLALCAMVQGAAAQAEKRIEFARGKSAATVKGSTGIGGVYYIIRAKRGQMLTLDLGPASKLGVKVETDGRYGHSVLLREERGGRYEVALEEAGDYTIFVGSLSGRSVPFTLTVGIRKLADI